MELLERRAQELIAFLITEVIILYFPARALKIHEIRRIRADEVDLLFAEQAAVCLRLGGIPADDRVAPEVPDIAGFREARLFQLGVYIEAVFLRAVLLREETREFFLVKACERHIEILALEVGQFDAQHLLIPARVERELVVRDDVRAPLRLCQMLLADAGNLLQPELLRRVKTAVPAEDGAILRGHDRREKSELPDAGGNLRHLLRTVCPRVAGIRHERADVRQVIFRFLVQIHHLIFLL